MKFLVVATPKIPPPPEILLTMLERGEEWQQRYEEKFDAFGLFPGGGGFGVANVDDGAELHRMLAEMPFTPFSDVLIKPVVDAATGWRQAREATAAMLAAV